MFRSEEFAKTSRRGLYGDVIEEIDWSVGQILETLRERDLDERTLVFFSSDNGPWLIFDEQGGSAGLLRDGKGSTWEGGMRVPGIAWWPGTIPAGIVTPELGCTMDLYTTAVRLAGAEPAGDRMFDGVDLRPVLLSVGSPGEGSRQTMFYYRGPRLMAVRHGPWKAHLITQPAYGGGGPQKHDPPVLYHLEHDPGEKHDLAAQHPEVIAEIRSIIREHQANLDAPESQLEIPLRR